MDQQLIEAFGRVGARKAAISSALDGDDNNLIGVDMDVDGSPMFIGTDLIGGDVLVIADKMARTAMAAMLLEEVNVHGALTGLYVDGMLVGLELANLRELARADAAIRELTEALRGVVTVADRETDIFRRARAALERYEAKT